jgi:Na+:H+ antiporter, NhaA family
MRKPATAISRALQDFFHMEASGGIVLAIATVFAMIAANGALAPYYQGFLEIPGAVVFGGAEGLVIEKPLLLWVNDAWMAIFFFLVGLEIKREFKAGELSSMGQVALPGLAAIGGMIVPALFFVGLNWGSPENLNGWAIPAATDIAFALAVLSLLGTRVPASLKVLLLAIAIFDDLGAIVIIAMFYSSSLSPLVVLLALIPIAGLVILNLSGVTKLVPYLLLAAVLWVIVLKSGVHATLAGVVAAFAIPMTPAPGKSSSMLVNLEHELHIWVAFLILPMFAFANAGVSFAGMGLDSLTEPVTLGIALGLFVGKQLGIFGVLFLTIRTGIAPMPSGANWLHLYGVAALAGIGFTMSLFIGGLAFEHSDFMAPIRLGVLTGSIASGIVGFLLLLAAGPGKNTDTASTEVDASKAHAGSAQTTGG